MTRLKCKAAALSRRQAAVHQMAGHSLEQEPLQCTKNLCLSTKLLGSMGQGELLRLLPFFLNLSNGFPLVKII